MILEELDALEAAASQGPFTIHTTRPKKGPERSWIEGLPILGTEMHAADARLYVNMRATFPILKRIARAADALLAPQQSATAAAKLRADLEAALAELSAMPRATEETGVV